MAYLYDTPQLQTANIGGIGNSALTTANTAKDGTGTVATIFTAKPVEGSQVFRIRCVPAGTNVASVLRVWINNGSATSTATNNILWREISLPATTLTEVAAQTTYYTDAPIRLPDSYRLTCAIGTSVAAGWYISVEGADY
jgi:hypothetical protein